MNHNQFSLFPPTRYMGSKTKIIPAISEVFSGLEGNVVIDLFSGSGVVSYALKCLGKRVVANDYMALNYTIAKALIENNNHTLDIKSAKKLLQETKNDKFVQTTFDGIYFEKEENRLIDNVRANIKRMRNPYKKAIAVMALTRACVKRRPRGIFTYTGFRYDDGRKDLKTKLSDHFLKAVSDINKAVFDNCSANKATQEDAFDLKEKADIVYMDPPYYSEHSDNEYVRRYHFIEGIACDWNGVEMQLNTKTKKFKNYPTPFSTKVGTYEAFEKLFEIYKEKIIVLSYSSNSLPNKKEILSMLGQHKSCVSVIELDHKYSFGNQGHRVGSNKNNVKEYLFVGK